MTIAAILDRKGSEVATTGARSPISQVVRDLYQRRIGALVVTDGDSVLGVISERDVVRCLSEHGAAVLDMPVSEVMTAPAVTVEPATPAMTALAIMTQQRFRHLPVVVNGQLRGIVSIGDLVKYRIEAIEEEAAAMRQYIQSA